MNLKFLHCADLHLDSPLLGLDFPQPTADLIRNASRRAFEGLIRLAMEEDVRFVLIAGDIYDAGLRSYESALYFNRQMVRLKEAGIKVFLIYGNHDAHDKLEANTRLPGNVTVFSHHHAESVIDADQLGIAIHGQSFGSAATTADLAAGYPDAVPDLFNIGLLHTSLNGIAGHDRYAPCSLETLERKRYQYWALGHIHTRQVISQDPWIVYPGNIQARHMRETGEKTCEIVRWDGARMESTPHPVALIPWYDRGVDLTGADTRDQVDERLQQALQAVLAEAGERTAVVRFRFRGATAIHAQLAADPARLRANAQAVAEEVAGGQILLERLIVDTAPYLDLDQLAQGQDPLGEVLRTVRSWSAAGDGAAAWPDDVAKLLDKLPRELTHGPDALALDAESLKSVLPEVEKLLAARLALELPE